MTDETQPVAFELKRAEAIMDKAIEEVEALGVWMTVAAGGSLYMYEVDIDVGTISYQLAPGAKSGPKVS